VGFIPPVTIRLKGSDGLIIAQGGQGKDEQFPDRFYWILTTVEQNKAD